MSSGTGGSPINAKNGHGVLMPTIKVGVILTSLDLCVQEVQEVFQKRCSGIRGEVTFLKFGIKTWLIDSTTTCSDEYCPHCDNHFVLDALTPKAALQIEGEDARVNSKMLKDDRLRTEQARSIFDVRDAPDRLG